MTFVAKRRLVVVVALALSAVPFAAQPAAALAAYIHVNTTSDVDAADTYCSLREAIIATNVGGGYRDCTAGTPGTDTILFDVSLVNVSSALPAITVPIFINGAFNGGRAEIKGPGSGHVTALDLQGSGTSSVRNLVIDNFDTAIESTAANLTVAGNVLGPNSQDGLYVSSGIATVGGSNSGSPNPCSDDCNVISGNVAVGIYWASATGTISGNFIGLDGT